MEAWRWLVQSITTLATPTPPISTWIMASWTSGIGTKMSMHCSLGVSGCDIRECQCHVTVKCWGCWTSNIYQRYCCYIYIYLCIYIIYIYNIQVSLDTWMLPMQIGDAVGTTKMSHKQQGNELLSFLAEVARGNDEQPNKPPWHCLLDANYWYSDQKIEWKSWCGHDSSGPLANLHKLTSIHSYNIQIDIKFHQMA